MYIYPILSLTISINRKWEGTTLCVCTDALVLAVSLSGWPTIYNNKVKTTEVEPIWPRPNGPGWERGGATGQGGGKKVIEKRKGLNPRVHRSWVPSTSLILPWPATRDWLPPGERTLQWRLNKKQFLWSWSLCLDTHSERPSGWGQ